MNKKLMIVLYVAAGLALGGIGFSAYVLVAGIGRLNETRGRLDLMMREVGRYYDEKPFASAENIAAQKKKVADIEGAFSNLVAQLKQGQVAPSGTSPAIFMDMLAERRNKMEKTGREKGVVMPEGFAFGFDRYFVKGSALPDKSHVPRLNQQLTVVENLCGEFFKEKIRINAFAREEFEDPAGTTPSTPRSRHPRGAAVTTIANKFNPQTGIKAPGELWATMSFILDCSGTEKAVLNILNQLARSPMFVVVTSVKIDKEGQDVRTYVPPKGAETNASSVVSAPVGKGGKAPTREDRLVCGKSTMDPGSEVPVRAQIEMDVCMQWGE